LQKPAPKKSYNLNRYLPADNQLYPRKDNVEIEGALRTYYTKIRLVVLPNYIQGLAKFLGQAQYYNLDQCSAQAARILGELDRTLGGNPDGYVVKGSKGITVADCFYYSEIVQLVLIGFDLSGYKDLCKWIKRVTADEVVYSSHKRLREMVKKLG
jgi:glutathione S-transferase